MLIGFIGKIGTGKTTASNYLVDNYGFTKHNFKDALDAELSKFFPDVLEALASYEGIDKDEFMQYKPTPDTLRQLKQNYGTEVRRAENENYWVSKWIKKYETMFGDNVCADDVRFINEVEAIKRMGGIIVRLECPDIKDTGSHESETALDEYRADVTITADKGDLTMIHMSLDSIVENDIGNGEEDGIDSGAYDEFAKESD